MLTSSSFQPRLYGDIFGSYSYKDFENNTSIVEGEVFNNCKRFFRSRIREFANPVTETHFIFNGNKYLYFINFPENHPRIFTVTIVNDRVNHKNSSDTLEIFSGKLQGCIGRIRVIDILCPHEISKYLFSIVEPLCTLISTAYDTIEDMFRMKFPKDSLVCKVNLLVNEILRQRDKSAVLRNNFWMGLTDITDSVSKSKYWKYFFSEDSVKEMLSILKINQNELISPFEIFILLTNSSAKDLMLHEWTKDKCYFSKLIQDINDAEYDIKVKLAEESVFFRKNVPTGYATFYLYENAYFHVHITYPKDFEDDFLDVLVDAKDYCYNSIHTFLNSNPINSSDYIIKPQAALFQEATQNSHDFIESNIKSIKNERK